MVFAAAVALAAGQTWQTGLIVGGVLAMSSTAIVSKTLSEQAQLHTPAGRQIMGVLLFQDLAVIPLLVLIPALALPAEALAGRDRRRHGEGRRRARASSSSSASA